MTSIQLTQHLALLQNFQWNYCSGQDRSINNLKRRMYCKMLVVSHKKLFAIYHTIRFLNPVHGWETVTVKRKPGHRVSFFEPPAADSQRSPIELMNDSRLYSASYCCASQSSSIPSTIDLMPPRLSVVDVMEEPFEVVEPPALELRVKRSRSWSVPIDDILWLSSLMTVFAMESLNFWSLQTHNNFIVVNIFTR